MKGVKVETTSLLPTLDATRRTGCIGDPDEAAILWAKLITDDSPEPRSFLLVKLWTREAWLWTLYAIDLKTQAVIATAVAEVEKVAFEHLKYPLRQRGFVL